MDNKVLATVAGRGISVADVENVIASYSPEEQAKMQNDTVKNKILEQLIATRLFALEAREKGLDKTKDFEELREKLKDEVLGQMMVTELVKNLKVSEAEEKEFYEANKDQFVTEPDVSAKHILVDSEVKAKNIKMEIENGVKTFEEAAREYSSCPSKDRGGDLGYFQRGQMDPDFEAVAFKTEVGKISEPVVTRFGWHLIFVNDNRPKRTITFEEAKDMIHNRLIRLKQKEDYIKELNNLSKKFNLTRG